MKLTEQEKFLVGQWMTIPGNWPLKRPERVASEWWDTMTASQRMRIAYHEWVHQMMLEGKL